MGERLQRAKKELLEEFERSGKERNLSFDDFLATSTSIIAEVYKDRQESTFAALQKMRTVLVECQTGNDVVNREIEKLKRLNLKRGLHCRRISEAELASLKNSIYAHIIAGTESSGIVVPCANTDEILRLRGTAPKGEFGLLEELVDHGGAHTLIAVGCPVDFVAVASRVARFDSECHSPQHKLLPEARLGRCLEAAVLSGNKLGWDGLAELGRALRCRGALRALCVDDNGVGEATAGPAQGPYFHGALAALRTMGSALAGGALRELSLRRNGIGPAGCALLADGVARSPTLARLDLSDNPLGLAGAGHLAQALAANVALTALAVDRAGVCAAGLRALCGALAANGALETLSALESVGPSGFRAAVACLGPNVALRALYAVGSHPWINPNHVPAARRSSFNNSASAATCDPPSSPPPRHPPSLAGSPSTPIHGALTESALVGPPATPPFDSSGSRSETRGADSGASVDGPRSPDHAGSDTDGPDADVSAQLQRMHDRERAARDAMRGLSLLGVQERGGGGAAALGGWPRELAQACGPDLPLGKVMPTAAQIVGRRAGGVDKSRVVCEWCRAAARPAGVGAAGHEAWECPRRFYDETGEYMPGFDGGGTKVRAVRPGRPAPFKLCVGAAPYFLPPAAVAAPEAVLPPPPLLLPPPPLRPLTPTGPPSLRPTG